MEHRSDSLRFTLLMTPQLRLLRWPCNYLWQCGLSMRLPSFLDCCETRPRNNTTCRSSMIESLSPLGNARIRALGISLSKLPQSRLFRIGQRRVSRERELFSWILLPTFCAEKNLKNQLIKCWFLLNLSPIPETHVFAKGKRQSFEQLEWR